jgi:AcrR family transcriptional regulator
MTTHRPIVRDEIDERILRSTQALIAKIGYERVRLIDIADDAGVSVGSLQHRYRTREGLIRATVIRSDETARADLLRSIENIDDPWHRLSALLNQIVSNNATETETSYWLQLVAAAARDDDLLSVMREQQKYWLQSFRETVETGLATGRIVSELSAEDLTTSILAFIDGLFTSRVLGVDYQNPKWVSQLLTRVVTILAQPNP